jgi:hypothetical protein
MADANAGHRVPFLFLDDVRTKFLTQFGRAYQNARENGLDDAFSRTIREQMARHTTHTTHTTHDTQHTTHTTHTGLCLSTVASTSEQVVVF